MEPESKNIIHHGIQNVFQLTSVFLVHLSAVLSATFFVDCKVEGPAIFFELLSASWEKFDNTLQYALPKVYLNTD